jgi:hypothetical protein
VTFDYSRRAFFTTLCGGLGLSGCHTQSQVPANQSVPQVPVNQDANALAFRLGSLGSVDLNSTAEQRVDVAHGSNVPPSAAKVILVDVVQDAPAIDTSALRWAPGYPVYDEAASTDTTARVLVRFAVPAGIPATGRVRILLAL